MEMVMNRIMRKITPVGLLRAAPDDTNMGGGQQSQQLGGGNDSQNNGNAGGSDDDDSDDGDDDSGSLSLLKHEDDSDDISIDHEEDDDEELTDEQKAAGETLKNNILAAIESYKVDVDSLPDDFDITDKKQLGDFLAKQQQQAMRSTIAMIPSILNHALGSVVGKLEKKLGSAVNNKSKETEAQRVFAELGYTGENKAIAKTMFERALKQKMTLPEARKATNRAMKALGVNPTAKDSGGGQKKTGSDALAGFF